MSKVPPEIIEFDERVKHLQKDLDNLEKNHPYGRYVGRALDAPRQSPKDPQFWLRNTNHPYRPFPDQPLRWESWVYDDASTCAACLAAVCL